jgi:hypothetical protein
VTGRRRLLRCGGRSAGISPFLPSQVLPRSSSPNFSISLSRLLSEKRIEQEKERNRREKEKERKGRVCVGVFNKRRKRNKSSRSILSEKETKYNKKAEEKNACC